jgi:hypothetical protein
MKRAASNPSGKLRVTIENGGVRVYRAELEQERQALLARDRAFLERLARFDPDWQQEQLREALEGHNDFAASFHFRELLRNQKGSVRITDRLLAEILAQNASGVRQTLKTLAA